MPKTTPKIIFRIDYQRDLNNVFGRLATLDPAGLEYRLKNKKDLDESVVLAILNEKKDEKRKKILDHFLKNYYQKNLVGMELVRDNYQKVWDEKQGLFFTLVTKKMGNLPWVFNEYRFFVSSFYSRAAWGKSNNLATWWRRKTTENYHMNGYELVLSHFFETVDQIYDDKRPVSDWHLWALAEITAHIVVFKISEVRDELWPQVEAYGNQPIEKNFKKGSYPRLANLAREVYLLFEENSDYEKYVRLVVDRVRNCPLKTLLG